MTFDPPWSPPGPVRRLYDRLEGVGPHALLPRWAFSLLLLRSAEALRRRDHGLLTYLNGKLNETEVALGRTRLYSLPTLFRVGVTRRCNLRCRICGVGHRTAEEQAAYVASGTMDLAYEDYRGLAAETFPYAQAVEFNQNGEAFVLGDTFQRMLALADRHGVRTTVSTNGMSVDRSDLEGLLGIRYLERVIFSMDGARKETVEAIRTGARFERIVENIRTLVSLRGDARGPTIQILFAAMRSNLDELPALVELASRLGVDRVAVSYLYVNPFVPLEESLFFDKERANRVFREAEEAAGRLGIELCLPPRFGHRARRGFRCDLPWNSPSILPGGYVVPCCMLFGKEHRMGHVGDGFRRIWNGPAYVRLRRSLVQDAPVIRKCRSCNFHHPGFDPDRLEAHLTEERMEMERGGGNPLHGIERADRDSPSPKEANIARLRNDFASRRVRVSSFPVQMFIESVKGCAGKCVMCGNHPRTIEEFPAELLARVRPYLRYLKLLSIHGDGESLLGKRLPAYVALCQENDCFLALNANPVFLTDRRIELLLSTRLSAVFSVHAGTAETYRKLMGEDFHRMKERLAAFSERNRREGDPRNNIQLAYLVLKENLGEIDAFLELSREVGLPQVKFMKLVPNASIVGEGYTREDPPFRFAFAEQFNEQVQRAFAERWPDIRQRAEALGIRLATGTMTSCCAPDPAWRKWKRRGVCAAPWLGQLLISQDGSVRLCCGLDEPIGNLNEQDLCAIWNDAPVRALRETFRSGRFPAACGDCPSLDTDKPEYDGAFL